MVLSSGQLRTIYVKHLATLQMHATEKSKWNVTSWMDQPYQKLTKWVYWLQYALDICCETHCKLWMSSTFFHPHCVGGRLLVFFMKWIWEICIVMRVLNSIWKIGHAVYNERSRLGFLAHKMVMIRSIINLISFWDAVNLNALWMSAEPVYNVACHVQCGYVEQCVSKVPYRIREVVIDEEDDVHNSCCCAGDC